MVGENGVPETPDWQPDARPCELDWIHTPSFETVIVEALESHIVRGTN